MCLPCAPRKTAVRQVGQAKELLREHGTADGESIRATANGVFSDADLRAATANISGYPGDKPSGTQWYDNHRVAAVDSRKVFYDIDTMGGQSGSAVYRIQNGKRIAVAVHAYGGATTNSGTRISTPVYNNLVLWNA